MSTRICKIRPAEREKLGLHLPIDVAGDVRVEAAVERETLSDVVARRLRESFARKPAPAVSN